MKYKLMMTFAILIISLVSSGCIFKPQEKLLPPGFDQQNMTIKYIENGTILDKNEFPGFNLSAHIYFVSPDNMPMTLDTEGSHNMNAVDASIQIPSGFKIYGNGEAYIAMSQRFMRLQYKVFDNDYMLDDLLNTTVLNMTSKGFISKKANGTYKGRVFVFENNTKDISTDIVLFKYDTVIGMIEVRDSGNNSINESLKILSNIQNKLKVNEKQIQIPNTFLSHQNSGVMPNSTNSG